MGDTMGDDARIGDMFKTVWRALQPRSGSSSVLRMKLVEALLTCLLGV